LFGGLDILIDNAAIGGEAFMEASEEDWRYLIDTNISGYLACAKEAAVRMRKQNGGQIILVGSISADNRGAHGATYAASKAAVQAFAESFAKEVAKDRIRVSLIEPGAVKSDMQDGTAEEHAEKVRKHEMLAAEDIAACTYYILSQPERCTVQTVRIVPRLEDEF
jgi:NADP-dependent 3-hydroxy acid dehydrogenase YdfG